MKLGLAYFHGYDQAKVDLEKEMGLQYVISGPHQLDPSLPAQSHESLKLLKDKYLEPGPGAFHHRRPHRSGQGQAWPARRG